MTDDPKRNRGPGAEIEFRLGELFGDLGAALEEAVQRLNEAGEGEVRREGTLNTGRGPIRATAGIRIRTAGGSARADGPRASDRPVNAPRATQRKAESTPDRSDDPVEGDAPVRPIAATILDEPDLWTLVADLPGVTEPDVLVTLSDGVLKIEAAGGGRRYRGMFDVPSDVTPDALGKAMRNGILELTAHRGGAA